MAKRKRKGIKKGRKMKKLNAYQRFCKAGMKRGWSMKQCGAAWRRRGKKGGFHMFIPQGDWSGYNE
jgi:hypothetical protein